MPNELTVKKMMEACDKDPKQQAELFKDPKAFAAEHDAKLADEEVEQLKKVGALMQLVDEFTKGRGVSPGPIFYPADIWWKQAMFNHIVSYRSLYNPLFNVLKYPIGYYFNVAGSQVSSEINVLRARRR
jgi:hypothetical protein